MSADVISILENPTLFEEKGCSIREKILSVLNNERNEKLKLQEELNHSKTANKAFQKALSEIGTVVIAVAHGDLSKKVQIHEVESDPEILKVKITINTMMDQLQTFANEVTKVATEVANGELGGQARTDGTAGVWRSLTDNKN
ncbi:unnamed protein product [[Candida] boidinii]|nr:unnamed protein product [[Candida] boidinii]